MAENDGVKVLRWNTLKLNKVLWSDFSLQEVLLYLENSKGHNLDLMPIISAKEACSVSVVCIIKNGFHIYWWSL